MASTRTTLPTRLKRGALVASALGGMTALPHTAAAQGAKNVELSKARAEAVRAYLVGKGIDAARIETRGAGPDEPIADNKLGLGRQKNRRIEFQLLPQ